MDAVSKYFEFEKYGTSLKREAASGAAIFIAMAYIVVVNPAILSEAGMPFDAALAATVLLAAFGTLLMGVYARRPFAVAPYMGENVFIAYTVCGVLGYSWQTALGAIFISGIILFFVTVIGGRELLFNSIPDCLKYSIGAGIGLFLILIGLLNCGLIGINASSSNPLILGNISDPAILLALLCFLIIAYLVYKKHSYAIVAGMVITTFIGVIFGITQRPEAIISMPPDITPVFMQMDIAGALSWGTAGVILTIFMMSFMDTMGTVYALKSSTEKNNEIDYLNDIKKPFIVDSLSNIFAPLFGTSTSGIFVESAVGIQAGARTGFAVIVTALLFLATLFLVPFISCIPSAATGPALIFVGMIMFTSVKMINFEEITEYIPAGCAILMMSFTNNIGTGICCAFVVYCILKTICGRYRDIKLGTWILFLLSVLYFVISVTQV